ncbi:AAA family ATPase [Nitrosomonas sp. Is37]|uniref:AAA family ATPase n=1 Tax=Nitrosomonas sp. Is37 TaxID=3080535 RepID=UPI00294B7F23|nr:AAA family ATPase [Nitrosomonas sp. Is37]MDV6344024.1 AAA family ATPase [Nitrosomonas sp. Is37]
MKIRKLNFVAFGPFTERALIFDLAGGGLHIVYGPNEAGKSSALRGLKALLYGIDERTPDNFLHDNEKLRIEGCMRAANGEELTLARRKGRKNTLLSREGEALDDKVLTPFLQGITQELFEMLFGIDHQALVQGGEEILEQKGEVGQALFSASLGSHTLHAVLAQLDEEADGLFRPRGATQTINSALKAYMDLNKEIRERSLSSNLWEEHRRALARNTKELEQIQAELASNRLEINRLKRIQRVLPKLARRHELKQKLEELANVTILPDDFGARRQQAMAERETAQAILQQATSRLTILQGQFEELSVREEVLEQSESIEALHARLGGHRKAIQDRPHLEAQYMQLLTDAESLLKDIRPDLALGDIEVLRPVLAKKQRITELGNQNPVLLSRIKQANSNLRDTEAQLEEARRERQKLPKVKSPDALHRAIALARKSGDMDSVIQSTHTELSALQQQCADHLARLTFWTGSLEDVPALPVPNKESINQFEQLYTDLNKRIQRLSEKQEETAVAMREALRRLDEIEHVGSVPTEDELMEIRTERDQTWQLLRRQWIEGEDVNAEASALDAERALPDAFEYRLAETDELADRLRREVERVHTKASLLAELENQKQRANEIEKQLDKCVAEKSQIDSDWVALWKSCKIQPQTPREMRAWLDDLEKLRERVVQLNTLRQRVSELEHTRVTQIQLIKQQLQSLGRESPDITSLEAVLLESEEIVDKFEEIIRHGEKLEGEIAVLKRNQETARVEFKRANTELDDWKVQWKEVLEGVGLEGNASPSEVAEIIEKLKELFAKHSEADKLQIRIQAMNKDADSFAAQVSNVVTNVAPELTILPADEVVMRLNALLSESRTRQSRRQQIAEQLQQTRQEILDSEATIRTMDERLDALCVEAKRASHAELEEAERNSIEYLRLKAEISHVEQELLEVGEGATLTELEAEAKDVAPDELPGKIDALTSKIDEELEPKRTSLAESKGRKEKEIELMNGSDHAASAANEGQSVLASIRINAERYVRLKLAARILRSEIERYRKENQGPLVKRASEHFAMLTCASFKELRADFNEKDEPILVGIRPNGEQVHVEGMSSGTRDQLYLALRLASLEKYMESSEPMPFIVDDILVDFDDERSEAALGTLSQLAQKTQVILFTHHSKVIEQAKKIDSAVQVHYL